MLFYSDEQLIDPTSVLFILLGLGIAFLLFIVWKIWENIMKAKERPYVLFIDLSTNKVRYLGQYIDRVDFDIAVESGNRKSFWGIKTFGGSEYKFIVPSFGNWEDMVMWDQRDLKTFVFVIGKLIGTGAESTDVHQQWLDDAFPSEVYDFEQPIAIPENFILCKPLWNRNMNRVTFQQNIMGIENVFTLFNKMINIQDHQLKMVYEHFGSLVISRISAANDHLLSQWEYILQAWNILHKERTVPLYVLTQLLHISPSRATYAALASALNQGGIQSAAPFLGNIKNTIEEVANSLDLMVMEKPNAEMLFQKVNQNKEELINLGQQNLQYEQNIRNLIDQNNKLRSMQVSSNNGDVSQQAQSNQPIDMTQT